AADDQVPPVARVDPQGMLVRVEAAVAIRGKRLPTVGRAVHADAQDVDDVLIGGIDPDNAEVHGARVEAVDTDPRLAAVRGLVNPAEVVTVRPLTVLDVRLLAAVHEAVGSRAAGTAGAGEGLAWGRAVFQGHHCLLGLLVAKELHGDLVAQLAV